MPASMQVQDGSDVQDALEANEAGADPGQTLGFISGPPVGIRVSAPREGQEGA